MMVGRCCCYLQRAIIFKHIECMDAIIKEEGCDVSKPISGWNSICYAILCGNIECVEVLINNGADVNKQSKTYLTPLHLAVHQEDLELITLLLENGADKSIVDLDGKTASEWTDDINIKNLIDSYDDSLPIKEPG